MAAGGAPFAPGPQGVLYIDPASLPTFSVGPKNDEREALSAGLSSAWAGLRYGVPYAVERLAGTLSPQDEAGYQAGLQSGAQAAQRALPGGPVGIGDWWSGRAGFGQMLRENIAYSLPQMGAGIAGAVAGSIAGGPVGAGIGAVAAGTPFFVGSNVQRATEEGTTSLTQEAAARSAAVAPLQAAGEALVDRFLPGAGKLFGGAAATQAGGFVSRTLKSMGKAAATEALTETGQQLGERYAAGLPLDSRDAMGEYVSAFGTAFFVGGALGAGGGIRGMKRVDPNTVPTEDLASRLDEALGRTPLALPSPEMFAEPEAPLGLPAPAAYTDAAGRTVVGSEGIDQLMATPVPSAPEPVAEPAPPPVLALPSPDAFAAPSGPVLTGDGQGRVWDQSQVNQGLVQPAAEPFQEQLKALTKGVNNRKQFMGATSLEDLQRKVFDKLDAGDSAKGTFTLAERLGLYDPANPNEDTELAAALRARKAEEISTPAPDNGQPKGGDLPVDAEFASTWKALTKGQSKAVKDLAPTSPQDLLRKTYNALGAEDLDEGVEKLAQKLGLLDDARNLTSNALELARTEPIPLREIAQAAVDQKLGKQQAMQFRKGVESYTGQANHAEPASESNKALFAAGQEWAAQRNAVPKVASNLNTQAMLDRMAGGTRQNVVGTKTVPETQQLQRDLNREIDAAGLGPTREAEMAALKKMVREGVAAEDVRGALARVQAGESLFDQPESVSTFTPAVVDRGAPRIPQEPEAAPVAVPKRAMRTESADAVARFAEARAAREAEEAFAVAAGAPITRERQIEALGPGNIPEAPDAPPQPADPVARVSQRYTITDNKFTNPEAERNYQALLEDEPDLTREELARRASGGMRTVRAYLSGGGFFERQGTPQRTQVTGAGAREVVTRATQGWKSKTKIAVYDSVTDLDPTDRQRLSSDGTLGFYDSATDTVHVIASNHATQEDVLATVYHETLGHRGLREAFSQKLSDILLDIYDSHPEMRAAADRYLRQTGKWAGSHKLVRQARATEEVLAMASEGGRTRLNLWQRLVSLVRKFGRQMGLKLDYSDADVRAVLAAAHDAIIDGSGGVQALVRGDAAMERTAPALNDKLQQILGQVTETARARAGEDLKGKIAKTALGWLTVNDLVAQHGRLFQNPDSTNGLKGYADAVDARSTIAHKLSQMFTNAMDKFKALEAADAKAAALVGKLMDYTTYEIDPAKGWAAHDWLHGRDDEARLRKLVAKANSEYNQLRRKPEQAAAYEEFKAVNQALHYADLATALYNLVASDPELKGKIAGADSDPMAAFIATAALHENASKARDFWQQALEAQIAGAKAYTARLRGAEFLAQLDKKQVEQMDLHLAPLEARLLTLGQSLATVERAPYFHLGRSGDYFGAFKLRLGTDGKVDPKAVDHVAKVLEEKGFGFAQIATDTGNPSVFLRMENQSQADNLNAVLGDLKAQGWLDKESDILVGKRSDEDIRSRLSPEWLTKLIERVRSDASIDGPERERMVAAARDAWLDMLPDTALAKVMTHRNAVPGYNKDMIRSFAFRAQVGINALAGLSVAPQMTDAFTQMRGAVKDANRSGKATSVADRVLMQNIVDEMSLRRDQLSLQPKPNFLDTLRAFNHTFFLGASPSYLLVNMTQLGVTLWPELAKKHGFAKAGTTIAKVTPTAFKVMQAVFAEGKAVGWSRAADAIITEKALIRSGVPKTTAQFIMKMVNTSAIDIGSPMRELARAADGTTDSKTDQLMRYAGAAGYYSETFSRLIAALAARELHGDKAGVEDYAKQVVNEAMFDYSAGNIARNTGKMGVAGQLTPVMFAFMQYSFQLMGKLYREMHTSFVRKDASAQEKAEARRFLGAHLAAVTTVAGTLGMPFASVLARAAEGLTDLFDDDEEPFDFQAAYRNFLADTFGEGVGDVLARGAPRALGFDLSTRAGEQDLLPFSRFITDRRKLEDAIEAQALDSLGSPASMLLSIAKGGRDMLNGDFLGGAKQMVPAAIKGPVEAYRMTTQGYVDNKGNKLPMEAGAQDILIQLIGLTPTERAKYGEQNRVLQVRETVLARDAALIRKGLARAYEEDDRQAMVEWMREAEAFDASNPAYAVLPNIGSTLQARARARAMAEVTQMPIGARMTDLAARDLVSW